MGDSPVDWALWMAVVPQAGREPWRLGSCGWLGLPEKWSANEEVREREVDG